MRRPPRFLRRLGSVLLLVVVGICLAVAIVPRFLDTIYYRGPASGHFDGARFFNPDGDDDGIAPPDGGSRAGFLLRYLSGRDGRPDWPSTVAVTPASRRELLQTSASGPSPKPASAADSATTPMVATWIGHSTVLVQTPGLNILTDPVWSDRVGPFGIGPRRVAAPGIRFDDLPRIDLIVLSHDHYDHMDLPTLKRLWHRDHPLIVTSLGNDALLRSHGIAATAADWGQAVTLPRRAQVGIDTFWPHPVTVHVTRNHHWGTRWTSDRNRTLWSSFVIELPGGNLFFGGDTGAGDMKWPAEAAAYGPIRLALLPIGAFRFREGQMGIGSHIGPLDASEVFRLLGASRAIGIHWGTFRLSWEGYDTPPRLLAAAMRCRGLSRAMGHGFDTVALGRPTVIAPYVAPPPSAPVDRNVVLRCLDAPAARALR